VKIAGLFIDNDKIRNLTPEGLRDLLGICPFNALEAHDGRLEINAACKNCNICVKNGPDGVFSIIEAEAGTPAVDKSAWTGVAVYIDHREGNIHPVSLELIGKARELADKVGFPVYALFMGHNIADKAGDLLHYGVDEVFLYDHIKLEAFLVEPYCNVFADFIERVRPSAVLVGATPAGRILAPGVAAKTRTGLTADCTKLDIRDNTDLIQIRPAFGGNIMAQIVTSNHRPQIATVRYKIFDAPARRASSSGKVTVCGIAEKKLDSRIRVVGVTEREPAKTISEAEIIVAAGRGIKSEKDLAIAYELAGLLGAEIATTRPLIEAGWIPANRQIGLSGRTVKPKLIITLGISGSVQFRAGMENSELIISINTDENAGILGVSHYAVKGDLYDIIPKLIDKIRKGGSASV